MAGSGTAHLRPADEVLLRVEHLVVEFPIGRTGLKVYAVSDVSLDIMPGETLGLVGESGCGKSTTGKAIMQLPPPTAGMVDFDGTDLTTLHGESMRRMRTRIQMIFQDPISSLNPRRKVEDIVAEGMRIWNIGDDKSQTAKVDEVLDACGLDPAMARGRRPHQFSGGQCQRISIARALVTEPKLVICDEPVSALDVSVQAQILNLLEEMKERYGLTLVFIAHDLAVVKNVSDRVVVMYLGKVCEVGPPDQIYERPAHPYTAALLAAIPVPDPAIRPADRPALGGEIPSPVAPPSGCRFRTRCPRAQDVCAQQEPEIREIATGQYVACHFPLNPGEVLPLAPGSNGSVPAA
ncbi:MAG TPA: oligopeptide/dipeptide ABC transporter ATP-binding protein [Acidimicrobiia bacterium]|jgi:peptide/nickel transport system ATP-binding protein|nr:oligopeptide/dipeptide ABC transporter ATP-binding protein [Acidimicrobiia bacterium]